MTHRIRIATFRTAALAVIAAGPVHAASTGGDVQFAGLMSAIVACVFGGLLAVALSFSRARYPWTHQHRWEVEYTDDDRCTFPACRAWRLWPGDHVVSG